MSRTDTRLAKIALVEFQEFQRCSKSCRAAASADSSMASISRAWTELFNGMLIVTVGSWTPRR